MEIDIRVTSLIELVTVAEAVVWIWVIALTNADPLTFIERRKVLAEPNSVHNRDTRDGYIL